jgi:beta-aspartyl-peptidase (threonine type)
MSAADNGGSSSKVVLIVLGVLGLLMLGGALTIAVLIFAVASMGPPEITVIDRGTLAEGGGAPAPMPVPVTSITPAEGEGLPAPVTSTTPVAVYGPGAPDDAPKDIRKLLEDQQQAWNRGDLDGFMAGYWKSDKLSFYSGKDKTAGWQATLERYRKRYQGEGREMGQLSFSDLEIDLLGPESALVRGRWQVVLSKEKPSGLFTLLVKKLPEGWRIVHDHTSTG